ncbi:MAG TPA: hypothetical protein VJR92_13135 [Gemmatimonadaceae bacterium]|nr:hypothetical protein [Gemmatimonadaceae bacterium]
MIAINLKPSPRPAGVVRPLDSFAASDRVETVLTTVALFALVALGAKEGVIGGIMVGATLAGFVLPRRVRVYLGGLLTGRRGRPTKAIVDEHGKRIPLNDEAFLIGMQSAEDEMAEHAQMWPWLAAKRIIRALPIPKRLPIRPRLPERAPRRRAKPTDDALDTLVFRVSFLERQEVVRLALSDGAMCVGRVAGVDLEQLTVRLSRRDPPVTIASATIRALDLREDRIGAQYSALVLGSVIGGLGFLFAERSWWLAGSLGTVSWFALLAATVVTGWLTMRSAGLFHRWERLYDANQPTTVKP